MQNVLNVLEVIGYGELFGAISKLLQITVEMEPARKYSLSIFKYFFTIFRAIFDDFLSDYFFQKCHKSVPHSKIPLKSFYTRHSYVRSNNKRG